MQHDFRLGEHEGRVTARLRRWHDERLGPRLWEKDPTLWPHTSPGDITGRLGWLDLPDKSRTEVANWKALGDDLAGEGLVEAILLGMGGSSLAPEVFAATSSNAPGYPRLIVLDTTHPDAVRDVEASISLERSIFIVSSKSGTTIETASLFKYFYERMARKSTTPGRHFIAITDRETPLESQARDMGFRRVFNAPPDVGGRFSALSAFGLVPAAIVGAGISGLLETSLAMAASCGKAAREDQNPGLLLGAALGELALAGRDKLTLFTSPSLARLPDWIEQLVAESTGKNGRGIVPIVGEPLLRPDRYGGDRVFVYISLKDEKCPDVDGPLEDLQARAHPVLRTVLDTKDDLGAEMFLWEIATSAACAVLEVNPFDQPDVEISKRLARAAMDKPPASETGPDNSAIQIDDKAAVRKNLDELMSKARPGSYISLQAYLQPHPGTTELLQAIRLRLSERTGLPTTLGYGPRFLHSTGQIHKGGPDTGIFIQIVDKPTDDLGVPSATYTFAGLIRAQSLGDLKALRQMARRVVRIEIPDRVGPGLAEIAALAGALET